jgi:ribosome-binding factor A
VTGAGFKEAHVSRRTERVGSLIRSIVAQALQTRLADPRIPTITSITRVEVSDDFAVARVFVSVMAPETQRRLCLAALRSASGLFRRLLAPELHLRKIPALDFRLDEALRHSFETLEVIDRAMRELGQVPEWEREADDEDAGEPGRVGEDEEPAAPGEPRARPQPEASAENGGSGQEGA